ncbi:MAG TPA: STAS domain-containing protein [Chitinophagales bacterium]|nr:STAS domain-containing protein [Chitinophagales bacterium]
MKNEIKDGVVVISLEGNLLGEHTNAPVMELIKSNLEAGNKKVLFNLADMKFINSTGLGMLLTAVSKTRNAGGEVALCSLPDQMKKLLQITKLESVFTVKADEASAIEYLKGA